MSSTSTPDAGLSATYVRWRDGPRGLGGIARLIHERGDLGKAEALDLHTRLGELLGVGGRGGARTKETWVPCGKKKRAKCDTCQTTPGHGPYLYRKEGKKWVRVQESDEQQAERRRRALEELRRVETQHALALYAVAHNEAVGFLQGEGAEEARQRVLDSIHS